MTINALVRKIEDQGPDVDADGVRISRWFHDAERYLVDFAPDFKGWEQFDTDQDAPYFGVWVHPTDFLILSFAEGDWAVTRCDGPATYNAEIRRMIDFYGEGFVAKALDDDGAWTIYRQDRERFLIAEHA